MTFFSKLFLLCFFGIVIDTSVGFELIDFKNSKEFWKELVNATVDKEANVTEHWMTQALDNFNDKENRTWRMRYLQDLSYWQPGGPLVILIGGESEFHKEYLLFPLYDNFAAITQGAKIGVEHRYYGRSVPINEWNVRNLQYLSSQQAIADLRNLILNLKAQEQYKNSKVVLFGGSYAGNLASWMRLQYPALVDAALASGAPVLAQLNFPEYMQSVGDVIKRFNPDCYASIDRKFKRFDRLFRTAEGRATLREEYNICNYTDMTKPHNKGLFILNKLRPYAHFVQFGKPKDIEICFGESKIANFAKYEFWNGNCNDYDFTRSQVFEKYSHGGIAWFYQTCNEFGYYQTTSRRSLFTEHVTINLYIDMCRQLFGFDRKRIEKGIKKTNKMYQGLTPKMERACHIHGDMDPWRKLGILEDLSDEFIARVLVNQSHGAGLFDNGRNVPNKNFAPLAIIVNKLKGWIGKGDFLYNLMESVLNILGFKVTTPTPRFILYPVEVGEKTKFKFVPTLPFYNFWNPFEFVGNIFRRVFFFN